MNSGIKCDKCLDYGPVATTVTYCPECLIEMLKHPYTKWQPIESAPKDGTRVLLWCPAERFIIFLGNYRESSGGWTENGSYVLEPTHFMPLPEPPEGE